MEFLEMVLIEIGKEAGRADRMCRDLEIVYVLIPVLADINNGYGRRRRHGTYYKIKVRTMARSIRLMGVSFQSLVASCRFSCC